MLEIDYLSLNKELHQVLYKFKNTPLSEDSLNYTSKAVVDIFVSYQFIPELWHHHPFEDTLLSRVLRRLYYCLPEALERDQGNCARRFVREWAYEDDKLPKVRREVFMKIRILLNPPKKVMMVNNEDLMNEFNNLIHSRVKQSS